MVRRNIVTMRAAVALLALALLLGPLAGPALAGPAAQEAAAPSYSFLEMSLGSRELVGPADQQTFSFGLPAGQQIAEGASLTLSLATAILDPTAELPADEAGNIGGTIAVSFNGTPLANLPLTAEAERSVTLDIPAAALADQSSGRYSLRVELRTRGDCLFGDAIRVTVRDDSRLTLPTGAAPVAADLSALPAPLFRGSFLPETATMVLPDAPTTDELRAAMIVAAGLGRQTGNRLGLTLRRSGDLTAAEYEASHLVFVGLPAKLPLLSELELPVPAPDGVFAGAGLAADDGLVQMAISPWDETKLALVVGGNNEAALLKAAQAFALGQLLVQPEQPELSLIAEVNRASEEMPPAERTFADLGYDTPRRVNNVGTSNLTYSFDLPVGQTPADESYVEIAFAHAAVIDYAQSSLTVLLNGSEIGGARLSDETVGLTRVRLTMPRDALRAGRNDLQLRVALAPLGGCVDRDSVDLWMSIWPDSRIGVPLEPAEDVRVRSLSLGEYPDFFTDSPSLATTAFVVGEDNPQSWEVAAQIIGSMATGTVDPPVDLAVAFDGQVAEELRQERNLVVVGRPSELALVGELNEELPAPFAPDSDQAIDRVSQVVYRLAEEENVGYLELLDAPWNPQRVVLAVLGNSPEGVTQAGQALARGSLQSRLGGTFALVLGEQIFIGGTRLASQAPEPVEPGGEAPAAAQPGTTVVTDTVQPVVANPATPAPASSPSLLLAFVGSVAVMLAVIGAVVGWMLYQRGRKRA